MSIWLQENSWVDVKKYLDSGEKLIIIPIGSTEQHGYHLPVGADTMVAIMLAEDAARRTNVLVTPPLWYGWSPHHLALPGSISVRAEVLIEIMYDIIRSLHIHGFEKFVVINGHRIVNIAWMQISAERAQRELGVRVKLFDPAYMSKGLQQDLGYGPVGHAEEIETSHMLYRHPELVHLENAKDNPIQHTELYSVDPAFEGDTLCYVPSTVCDMQRSIDAAGGTNGTPSKSDAQKGRQYHDHLVDKLVRVIEILKANA
jgi:creatinine amidohydrolase